MCRKQSLEEILTLYFSLVTLVFFSFIVRSFDGDREARIASQTLETLFIGEPVWLANETKAKNSFLGLVTSTNDYSYSILMIHGTGQGPDTPYVIGPMRELLSENGYETLSIQMPVLSEDTNYDSYTAEFNEAGNRIQAGIKFLRQASPKNQIIILGHSMGSTMLMEWINKNDSKNVSGIITIGLGSTNQKKSIDQVFSSADIELPILDILGEKDYDSVLWSAPLRRSAINATHQKSDQVVIKNADHFFNGHEKQVAISIASWIKSL